MHMQCTHACASAGGARAGRARTDARQRVERIEEGKGAALEVGGLSDAHGQEDEEAEEEIVGEAGDERVFAYELRHDGLGGHHRDASLEQDLLEGARVVVGVAVRQDDVRDLAARDAYWLIDQHFIH